MSKLWGAAGLGAVSLFMLLGFLRADVSGAPGAIAFLLTVGLPLAGAALLVRSHLRQATLGRGRQDEIRFQTIQSEVLRLAARRGGRLMVSEVMAELALDRPTCEAALERLHVAELAEIEITDSGDLVYTFPEIRRLDEKDSAKGLLDD